MGLKRQMIYGGNMVFNRSLSFSILKQSPSVSEFVFDDLNSNALSFSYKRQETMSYEEIAYLSDLDHEVGALSIMGLGLWRLRPKLKSVMASYLSRLEGIIRQCCIDDGLEVKYDRDFEYWDTLDPTGEKDDIDPCFATHAPDPKELMPGFPRLQIEKRLYKSRVFSKLRMAIAKRQDGLHFFNMVMFAKPEYELPIMWIDV